MKPDRKMQYTDLTYLRQTLDGDHEAICALLQIFVDSAPAIYARVQAALQSGDHAAGAAASHKLKGMLNLVGAQALTTHLQKIEKRCANALAVGMRQTMPEDTQSLARTQLFGLVLQEVKMHINSDNESADKVLSKAGTFL